MTKWNPEHVIPKETGRCVRCGMTQAEIFRYKMPLCPAGQGVTKRAYMFYNTRHREKVLYESKS